jgi:hypothetical protein
MAHFAKIGDTSKVLALLTLDNKDMLNADGVEEEAVGQKYLEKHNNWPAERWIQTSYNTRGGKHYDNTTGSKFVPQEASADQSKALRGNYAGLGYTWDKDNNIFYREKPHASWVLNTTTALWQSPLGDAPSVSEAEKTAHFYDWNEDNQSWDKKLLLTDMERGTV